MNEIIIHTVPDHACSKNFTCRKIVLSSALLYIVASSYMFKFTDIYVTLFL